MHPLFVPAFLPCQQFSPQTATQNSVGYQNKGFENTSGFNYICNTFKPVDSTKKLTLADITPNASFKNSRIQFLTNKGAAQKVEFDGRQVNAVYVYWREKDDPEEGEGWYLLSDEDGEINQGAKEIEFGDAYCVDNKDGAAANFTFSGAVAGETPKSFSVSGFNYIGNCSPTQIQLADVTPNASFKNSRIQFLTNKGAAKKVEFDGRQVNEVYVYWREKDDPEEGEGWYLLSDEDGEINQGAKGVAAGQAFCVDNKDSGAILTIPDPIN